MAVQTLKPSRPAYVQAARWAFVALCWLYAAGVAAQLFGVGMVFLAGQGAWLEVHRTVGHLIGFATPLALVSAFVARLPWPLLALTFGLIVLHGLQYTFIESGGVVRALHALNALVLFGLAAYLGGRVFGLLREVEEPSANRPPPTHPRET